MDSLFFKEHSVKILNFFSTDSQSFSLGRIHWSKSEFGALGFVLIISPSSDLGIAHRFFNGLLILQVTFCKNFKIFLNRLDQLASGSIGSSSQLVWSTDFGDFLAQFLHGLGLWAPDQFWAVFWIHFGPYLGFLAAHHESIWILGGEASWKLKIVSLHGKWGGELMEKLISRLTGALSRA